MWRTVKQILWDSLVAGMIAGALLLILTSKCSAASWIQINEIRWEFVETVPYGEGLQAQVTLAVVEPIGFFLVGDAEDCGINVRRVWGWRTTVNADPPRRGASMTLGWAKWNAADALLGLRFI